MDDATSGQTLIRTTAAGTGLLVVVSGAAAMWPDSFGSIDAICSGLLFVVGSGAMLWSYLRGISRSRVDEITISGLFFLAGAVAPHPVKRTFWSLVAVEVVAVIAAGAIRPYSEVAFGILAPMYGLGLMAAWSARHGTFPPRTVGS